MPTHDYGRGEREWALRWHNQKYFFSQNEIVLKQKLRKKVEIYSKNDTAKYEEMITELKQKGQIRKFKQIFYWSNLKPNTLKKTAIQNKNDSEEQHLCS